jgi:transposase
MSESKNDEGRGADSKSESKDHSEGKVDTDRGKLILQKVKEFCMGSNMEAEFEDFAREHKDVFLKSLDIVNMGGVQEHPVEFHGVYKEYLARFERKIENFIIKVSIYPSGTIVLHLSRIV